jgi:hypothetical protein
MVTRDTVWLSLIERVPTAGACELCATDPAQVGAIAVVRHMHGGTVEFAACDRCTRALKRLIAAIGDGQVALVPERPVVAPDAMPAVKARGRVLSRPRVLRSEMIFEFAQVVVASDGTTYLARVCGGPRQDGTWAGWLEFVVEGTGRVRRTGQETTQPNRDALVYWASGLEPVYLQGAFRRAR